MVWSCCDFTAQTPIDFSCVSEQCNSKYRLLLYFTPLGFLPFVIFHTFGVFFLILFPAYKYCILQYPIVGLHRQHKSLLRAKKCLQEKMLCFLSSPPTIQMTQLDNQFSKLRRIITAADHPQSLQKENNCFYIVDNLSANILLCIPPVCS